MVYCAGKLIENFKFFYESNRPRFCGFTGVITHLGCWQNTSARDLQAFRVFFQHPKWVITPVKTHRKCGLLLK